MKPVASPIAFLSDIHGNLDALKKVLAHLKQTDVSMIVAAGDHLLGTADSKPVEVWRLLQQEGVLCVRGLSEEALLNVKTDDLDPEDDAQAAQADYFINTRRWLGDLILQQIRQLPLSLDIPLIDGRTITVVHGSPADPLTEIEHNMSDDEIGALIHNTAATVVVCGASHVAFRRDVDDVAVVSVGSVGQSPTAGIAHYCVMTPRMDGLEVLLDHVSL